MQTYSGIAGQLTEKLQEQKDKVNWINSEEPKSI